MTFLSISVTHCDGSFSCRRLVCQQKRSGQLFTWHNLKSKLKKGKQVNKKELATTIWENEQTHPTEQWVQYLSNSRQQSGRMNIWAQITLAATTQQFLIIDVSSWSITSWYFITPQYVSFVSLHNTGKREAKALFSKTEIKELKSSAHYKFRRWFIN